MELSSQTKKLVQRYQEWESYIQPKSGIATINVDEVASKVASFYEKIREVIEWREEHLLRRMAIERALKRRLLSVKNGEEMALPLISELIRKGHFPNNRIPESKIGEAQKVINKYVYILENSPKEKTERDKMRLFNWLLSVAACEIEETLILPIREIALIEYMEEVMKERIQLSEGAIVIGGVSKEQKNTQIYIAVQRALFKLDPPIIAYNLLKREFPQWNNFPEVELKEISFGIYSIWRDIEKELNHPLNDKFYRVCERYDTPYLILGDIISENPAESERKIEEPKALEEEVEKAYNKRLATLNRRLARAAFYSTLSIFLTKVSTALAIEIPVDRYLTGQFNAMALLLNVVIPPLLMFLIVVTIRQPDKENLQRVKMEAAKIVYKLDKQDPYVIKAPQKSGLVLRGFIAAVYVSSFVVSFGLIYRTLSRLGSGVFSIIIFFVFACLISFAGIKIRERAKELQIKEEKEGFLSLIWDFFTLPFIMVGKKISEELEKHNALVVIFNSLIDMPFETFVEFLEQWRYFLREKKEKIH